MNPADLIRYEQLLRYELAAMDAADGLKAFCRFTMPDPKAPHDPDRSLFLPARHLDVLVDLMESVERGEILKAILNTAPRHGKSETATRRMAAWFAGRSPHKEVIVATYGEVFARNFARDIRAIIESQRFRQAFPDYALQAASDEVLTNHLGKNIYSLGRRSPTTGRGGDILLVDDPVKDDKEARSQLFRDDLWEWFTQTLLSRRHTDRAPVVLTQTRWTEDDIVGRITDRTNPKWSKEFSEGWEIVNLPALAEEDDPLGRKPGEALWPERFGAPYLEQMRAANPVAFSALYQCNPTPADGAFYLSDDLHTYERDELPAMDQLRVYGVSDHGVATSTHSDPSCLMLFGVDATGTAWILPDLAWRRMGSAEQVEEWLRLVKTHKPMWWYAERGHISRSIGPFLKKRMDEEGVYCPVMEEAPVGDKMTRAQSSRARCAQGRIRFPGFAGWWARARHELLTFPNGRHDDFVDALSLVGLKLTTHAQPSRTIAKNAPAPGTWAALKQSWKSEDEEAAARRARAGW